MTEEEFRLELEIARDHAAHIEYALKKEILELRGLYVIACKRLQELGETTVALTEVPQVVVKPDVLHHCRVCKARTMYVVGVPTAGPRGSRVNVYWCRWCGRLLVSNSDFIERRCTHDAAWEYFDRANEYLVQEEKAFWDNKSKVKKVLEAAEAVREAAIEEGVEVIKEPKE